MADCEFCPDDAAWEGEHVMVIHDDLSTEFVWACGRHQLANTPEHERTEREQRAAQLAEETMRNVEAWIVAVRKP
jgi:hypothetical protein